MNKIFLTLLAGFALASCTETSLETIADGSSAAAQAGLDSDGTPKVEVKAEATANDFGGGTLTRTPYQGKVSEGNILRARVLAYQTDAQASPVYDYSTLFRNGFITFADTISSFEQPLFFDGSKPVTLFGFTPAERWTENGTSIAFDGSMDVMTANAVVTNKALAKQGIYPKLVFNHELTNLVISVKGIPELWGDIIGFNLTAAGIDKNQKPKYEIEYNKATGKCTFKDDLGHSQSNDLINDENMHLARVKGINFFQIRHNDSIDRNFYSDEPIDLANNPVQLTGDKQYLGYAMVQPINQADPDNPAATDEWYFFTFYTTMGPGVHGYTVKVPKLIKQDQTTTFAGDTKGHGFGILFDFSGELVEVTTEGATEWDNGGTIETDMQDNLIND